MKDVEEIFYYASRMAYERRKKLYLIESAIYQAPIPREVGKGACRKEALVRVEKVQARTVKFAAKGKTPIITIRVRWNRGDIYKDGFHLSSAGKNKVHEAFLKTLKEEGYEWQEK